jgi:hypothetical protein
MGGQFLHGHSSKGGSLPEMLILVTLHRQVREVQGTSRPCGPPDKAHAKPVGKTFDSVHTSVTNSFRFLFAFVDFHSIEPFNDFSWSHFGPQK